MKLKFMILASLLLLSMIAMNSQPVKALPFDNEYTNQSLTSGDYDSYYIDLTSGDTISGYYETDDTTMGLDFFIADDANYTTWVNSGGGTGYEIATNMHTNYFSLDVPSTDTWWIVFINNDDVTVWFDAAVDINGENYPYYSSSDYDHVENDLVVEVDERYYAWGDYNTGTTFTVYFSTYFTSDPIDFFICDEANFNIWDSGGTPTVYASRDGYHSISGLTFTAPYSDTWYFVFSNVDGIDTVTLCLGIEIDTSGATSGTTPTTPTGTIGQGVILDISTIIIAIAAIFALLVVCLVVCRKRQGPTPGPQPGFVRPPSGPPVSSSTADLVEGALKSYPRVSMTELSDILGLPVDEVRRATLMLIASDEVHGTFNKDTDEFTSVQASKVGREIRDTTEGVDIARCPNCGAPLSGSFVIGDKVRCPSCGVEYTV